MAIYFNAVDARKAYIDATIEKDTELSSMLSEIKTTSMKGGSFIEREKLSYEQISILTMLGYELVRWPSRIVIGWTKVVTYINKMEVYKEQAG